MGDSVGSGQPGRAACWLKAEGDFRILLGPFHVGLGGRVRCRMGGAKGSLMDLRILRTVGALHGQGVG